MTISAVTRESQGILAPHHNPRVDLESALATSRTTLDQHGASQALPDLLFRLNPEPDQKADITLAESDEILALGPDQVGLP